MGQDPREAWRRLQATLASAQQRGGGSMPFGGNPRNIFGGAGAALLLGGGAMALYNSLFNVDGGHRAIKYTRIGGVQKEIYNEGKAPTTSSLIREGLRSLDLTYDRHSFSNSLVRDTHHIRRPCQTAQCRLLDRNQRSSDGEHNLSCTISSSSRCSTTMNVCSPQSSTRCSKALLRNSMLAN